MPETIKLNDNLRAIIKARIKAAKDKAAERDRNCDDDKGSYATEGERNLALLAGRYWVGMGKLDVRSINHMALPAISKHALVTNGKREFVCKPTSDDYDDLSEVAKGLLNHTWRTLGLEKEFKAAYWDVAPLKFGVVEIGWQFEEAETTAEPGENGEDGEMQRSDAQKRTPTPHKDDPFVERFDPRDLIIDPQCKRPDLSDARYVFRRKESYLADIKANPRYQNTANVKPTGSAYAGKEDSVTNAPYEAKDAAAKDFDTVYVYDGYMWLSLKPGEKPKFIHIVWAEGMDKELLCEPFLYEWQSSNPYPFEIICNWMPSNDNFEPASDVSQSRHVQIEHDESYTQVCKLRKVATSKLTGPELDESSDSEVIDALESGDEGRYVGLPERLLGRVNWLNRPPTNMDAYNILQDAPQKMKSIWGVNEFQLNETPDRKMLAAEVNALGSQGGTRQEGELQAYNDFCCRGAYKILALLQQFSDTARKYMYTTDAGEETWGKANLENLRGMSAKGELHPVGIQFAIEIDAAGTGNRNKYTERKEATDMMGALAQFAQMPDPFRPGQPLINMRTLIREYVKTYGLSNIAEIVSPEPTDEDKFAQALQVIQQQQQQLQQMSQKLQEMQAALQSPMQEIPQEAMPAAQPM